MLSETLLTKLRRKRELPSPDTRRAIRKDLGLSGADVATELGVTVETLYRWERGQNEPTGDNLERYATLLDALQQVSEGAA